MAILKDGEYVKEKQHGFREYNGKPIGKEILFYFFFDNISDQYVGETLTAQFSINKDTLSFNSFITSNEDDRFNLELKGGMSEIMEGVTKFLGSFNDYLNF